MTLKEMYIKAQELQNELNNIKFKIGVAEHKERVEQMCKSKGFPIGCIVEYQGEKRIVVGCKFDAWCTLQTHISIAKINKSGDASKVTKDVLVHEIKLVND